MAAGVISGEKNCESGVKKRAGITGMTMLTPNMSIKTVRNMTANNLPPASLGHLYTVENAKVEILRQAATLQKSFLESIIRVQIN